MKSSVLYDIIDAGAGKREFTGTISRKMKRDIVDFFSFDKAKTFDCLELGFWRGHTTYILSHLFKTVTAVDINDGSKIIPEALERDNTEFIYPMDIYDSNPDNVWRKLKTEETYPEFNIFFIDCVHDAPHVQQDVNRCLSIADLSKPVYFIIDDYGTTVDNNTEDTWNGSIKQYIRALVIRTSNFKVVSYIGEDVGFEYSKERNPLRDREGVILKWQI
tara:strand:+ start:75 stop:728 length:654 start_codon:yes stop_codon:yes gene_type:complete